MATTFAQSKVGSPSGASMPSSFGKGFEYSRTGNPTRGAYELAVASAESGKYGLAFSSGIAAVTACANLLGANAHVVASDDVYGGTQRYFRLVCNPQMGQTFDFVDLANLSKLEAAIKPNTKMIWVETPSNPTLKLTDISAVAAVAKKNNCLLVVDNTFMSPYFQKPLALGADIVMNSVTKYMNGHSDVVGGVLATDNTNLNDRLRFLQNSMGAVPSPFDCYLAMRGLKTLHLRMERHAANAMAVAELLEKHPAVFRVISLPSSTFAECTGPLRAQWHASTLGVQSTSEERAYHGGACCARENSCTFITHFRTVTGGLSWPALAPAACPGETSDLRAWWNGHPVAAGRPRRDDDFSREPTPLCARRVSGCRGIPRRVPGLNDPRLGSPRHQSCPGHR